MPSSALERNSWHRLLPNKISYSASGVRALIEGRREKTEPASRSLRGGLLIFPPLATGYVLTWQPQQRAIHLLTNEKILTRHENMIRPELPSLAKRTLSAKLIQQTKAIFKQPTKFGSLATEICQ